MTAIARKYTATDNFFVAGWTVIYGAVVLTTAAAVGTGVYLYGWIIASHLM